MKRRLDQELVRRGLVPTRSQAESYVRLGSVSVGGRPASKAGQLVSEDDDIRILAPERYVSRAGLKLASVAAGFKLDFDGKTVLDVGSSTGGFTDYALQHGAAKIYAVDVGTDQLHASLREDGRIELHEKTDIRDFRPSAVPDIVLADVSFISLREILPHVAEISGKDTSLVVMVKPQFEAGRGQVNKGVVKNDTIRRRILKDFETWAQRHFLIVDKADSDVPGSKGNSERFYVLKKLA